MPGHNGQVLLTYEFAQGGRMQVGLYDDDMAGAIDHLLGVIRVSAEDRCDPTTGTWYCERLDR